jgi:FHA domain
MTADPNRKTLRHFYCRDSLWHSFERMSEDLDRGVDELVNEAMRFFAREKGYLPTDNEGPRPTTGRTTPPAPPARRPVQATPGSMRTSALPMRAVAPSQLPSPAAARPAPFEPPEVETVAAPALYLMFQNQKYLIDKEQFIIGRGSKSSDLPIRDGNISRKHAAVIRRNGAYFIKDLGSTNGIDYNGVRIDNKRIEEGDVFNICDYELRFTFR